MATGAHPAFAYDDDSSWTELRSWLAFQVRGRVYDSHIPDWLGQEDEITDDIVSECLKHLIERLEQASAGSAAPIINIYPFARQIAFHCFVDQWRKDKKNVRFSQIAAECEEETAIGLILADMEDATLNAVYYEQLFRLIARDVVTFPKKQKEAMLRDHAKRMVCMTDPLPLLRAYEGVGIQLIDYLNHAPADEVERRRHSSLLHWAYQRLARCPSVQQYIAGMVKKSA
jgi:DNA-directed RNA polymerase specialized sigma24 family protein